MATDAQIEAATQDALLNRLAADGVNRTRDGSVEVQLDNISAIVDVQSRARRRQGPCARLIKPVNS